MIYFIQGRKGGLIKIGFTAGEAKRRLRQLQHGCPVKLALLATLPGEEEEEAALHTRFAHLRRHGEWFRPAPDLLEFIARERVKEDRKRFPPWLARVYLNEPWRIRGLAAIHELTPERARELEERLRRVADSVGPAVRSDA